MKHFDMCAMISAAGLAAVLAAPGGVAQAGTLYDPALNTLPSAQGWTTAGFGVYSQSVAAGAYHFDTLPGNSTMAGSALVGVPALDTAAGFTLDFNLKVLSESHTRDERAGFSLIVTGLDPTHAIEIAFWTDHVWGYTASFQHGVDAAFATTVNTDYSLVVHAQTYTLLANGASLLSGVLVDYGAQGAPYTTPGLLFFGDDTTSGKAAVELGSINVTAVPEPTTTALLGGGLLALVLWRRRAAQVGGIGLGLPSPSMAT